MLKHATRGLVLLLVGMLGARAGEITVSGAAPPDWLTEQMATKTANGGRWTTPNPAEGGVEAFGIEWRYGVGKQSLIGRLYGLTDGAEQGDYWEYRLFWHPKESRAILQQFGGNGAFATGEMVRNDDTGNIVVVQELYSPDGSAIEITHESSMLDADQERSVVHQTANGQRGPEQVWIWTRETSDG